MNAAIDITGVTLHTPRLTLRPWEMSDLEDFYAYASVDGVGQMAGWMPHKSIEESERILTSFIQAKKTFAIVYEGRAVGSLGIEECKPDSSPEMDALRCRELGFVLARDCWGMGLMPEAVKAVLAYLFETVGLDAVLCAHFDWNHQSARVQEKCGFRFLKESEFTTRMNTVEHSKCNVLYREDWMKK